MTTTDLRDDLGEFEAEFAPAATAAPTAPAVPAHISSAARRRADDEKRGYRAFAGLHALGISGLVISMAVLALVAFHTPA